MYKRKMEAKIIIITLLALCLTMTAETERSDGYYSNTTPAHRMVEKVTRVRIYLHDILSGRDPRAIRVAHANLTRKPAEDSPVGFGSVFVTDDKLTAGPERESEEIGNARGMYVSASKDLSKFTIVMYIDFGFTTGKFNGSSFTVFSRNPVAEGPGEREVAVVGGSGKFRMARGFAKVRTHFIDMKTGDAILGFNVTIFHY